MLTLGRITLQKYLDKRNLTLLSIDQKTYRGKRTSDIEVKGYSRSLGRMRTKTFRIMSVDPDVIGKIIDKHWY